jgi:hypothetical protein
MKGTLQGTDVCLHHGNQLCWGWQTLPRMATVPQGAPVPRAVSLLKTTSYVKGCNFTKEVELVGGKLSWKQQLRGCEQLCQVQQHC